MPVARVLIVLAVLCASVACPARDSEAAPKKSNVEQPLTPAQVLSGADLSKTKHWSFDEQWAHEVAARGAVMLKVTDCPSAEAISVEVAKDEFERRDQRSKVESAMRTCAQAISAQLAPLPALALLDLEVKSVGEYDFDEQKFDLLLSRENTPAAIASSSRNYFSLNFTSDALLPFQGGYEHVGVATVQPLSTNPIYLEGLNSPLLRHGERTKGTTSYWIVLKTQESSARELKSRLKDPALHLRAQVLFRPLGYGRHVLMGAVGRVIAIRVIDDRGELMSWAPFDALPGLDSLPIIPR